MGNGRSPSDDVLVEPWLVTDADVPWMNMLGRKRYAEQYDFVGAENWVRNVVLKQPMIFYPARLQNSFCVSMMSIQPWIPTEMECNVIFICAENGCMWEAIHLLRSSIAWAKSRKCASWKIASDTDYDLASIATRLGADVVSPRYVLRF